MLSKTCILREDKIKNKSLSSTENNLLYIHQSSMYARAYMLSPVRNTKRTCHTVTHVTTNEKHLESKLHSTRL